MVLSPEIESLCVSLLRQWYPSLNLRSWQQLPSCIEELKANGDANWERLDAAFWEMPAALELMCSPDVWRELSFEDVKKRNQNFETRFGPVR